MTTPAERVVSACTGSVMTALLVTPLDVVRVRQQMQTQQVALQSTRQLMVGVAGREGVSALWSGLGPTLAMSIPQTVLYFVGYDALRQVTGAMTVVPDAIAPGVSGATARAIAAVCVAPLELVKTLAQAAGEGRAMGVRRVIQQHGLCELWRGMPAMLWRDIPFSGIYWTGYEKLRDSLAKAHSAGDFQVLLRCLRGGEHPSDHLRPRIVSEAPGWCSFVAGATSGSLAALLTHPFDVVKTRQQGELLESGAGGSSGGAQKESLASKRVFATIRYLVQTEGVGSIYRGLGARVGRVAPGCAIMITSYEAGKRFFAYWVVREREEAVAVEGKLGGARVSLERWPGRKGYSWSDFEACNVE